MWGLLTETTVPRDIINGQLLAHAINSAEKERGEVYGKIEGYDLSQLGREKSGKSISTHRIINEKSKGGKRNYERKNYSWDQLGPKRNVGIKKESAETLKKKKEKEEERE